MSRLLKFASTLLVAASLVTGAAQAQDRRSGPSYGEATLSDGFTNDIMLEVLAGGPVRILPMRGCPGGGYINAAPSFRVHYRAGEWPLIFYVRAHPRDTILLVNDPAGHWHCNDDYQGLDPAIQFAITVENSHILSGEYNVWVGSYGPEGVLGAMLYITSTRPFFR